MTSFTDIERAAHESAYGNNSLAEPTTAQQDAGNYKKGRVSLAGIPLVIENPRGSLRQWRAPDGTSGANLMKFHYGYVQGVKGADGDELDMYIGPVPESNRVFVVNQNVRGAFDEHKVMLGFPDRRMAEAGYLSNFNAGWPGLASCVACSINQLKWWMANGDLSKPLTPDQLPFEGRNDMDKVLWDGAQPRGTTLARVLYDIRAHDGRDQLIFDPVTVADIQEDAESILALDALVIPYKMMEPRMAILRKMLDRAVDGLTVADMQVTEPFTQKGTTNVATVFELSDGQTLAIFFHNPDTTPKKILPTDDLISWKWMLNKKDVTIAVAPERGRDLNVRTVAMRVMMLAAKNSARFAQTNATRAARMQSIDGLKQEFAEKEATLDALQTEINQLEAHIAANPPKAVEPTPDPDPVLPQVVVEPAPSIIAPAPAASDTLPAVEPDPIANDPEPALQPTTPAGYAAVMADEALQLQYQDVLDAFLGERMSAVRSALYEREWAGIKDGSGDMTKSVEGATYRAHFVVTHVGAGANIISYYTQVMDGSDVQAEIGDNLTLSPESVAAQIDAVFNSGAVKTQPVDPTPEPAQTLAQAEPTPEELAAAEAARAAQEVADAEAARIAEQEAARVAAEAAAAEAARAAEEEAARVAAEVAAADAARAAEEETAKATATNSDAAALEAAKFKNISGNVWVRMIAIDQGRALRFNINVGEGVYRAVKSVTQPGITGASQELGRFATVGEAIAATQQAENEVLAALLERIKTSVLTDEEQAAITAHLDALEPQIEALTDPQLAMMAATAPLNIGGFDKLATDGDATGYLRDTLIQRILANHPDDIEASLDRWRELSTPAEPTPEELAAAEAERAAAEAAAAEVLRLAEEEAARVTAEAVAAEAARAAEEEAARAAAEAAAAESARAAEEEATRVAAEAQAAASQAAAEPVGKTLDVEPTVIVDPVVEPTPPSDDTMQPTTEPAIEPVIEASTTDPVPPLTDNPQRAADMQFFADVAALNVDMWNSDLADKLEAMIANYAGDAEAIAAWTQAVNAYTNHMIAAIPQQGA